MDALGVNDHCKMKAKREGKRRTSSRKSGVKVVYISSPMKVKTSASEFRMIVQELTGRDSDVVRIMEATTNDSTDHHRTGNSSHLSTAHHEKQHQFNGTVYYGLSDSYPGVGDNNHFPFESESPTESESFVDGNLFSMPHVERSFRENNFPIVFQEPALLDVFY